MVKNTRYRLEESGIFSNQKDKPTDYSFIKKKNILSNLIHIPILTVKIFYLWVKILIEEFFRNFKKKNFIINRKNI